MKKNLSQNPISIANSSGFPLQIAISKIVRESSRWKVLLEEHPWRLDINGEGGFIDIVVEDKISHFETFVIECKRVRQTAWVFLLPKPFHQKSINDLHFESERTVFIVNAEFFDDFLNKYNFQE
jgi:hypothetical protein